jgi:hypothetical protein
VLDVGFGPDALNKVASEVVVKEGDVYGGGESDTSGGAGCLKLAYNGKVVGAGKAGEERGGRLDFWEAPVRLVSGRIDAINARVEVVG